LQIHRVRGRDLRDALQRAAKLYGEQAEVLSQEHGEGGEVTIAVGTEGGARDRLAAMGFRGRGAEPRPDQRGSQATDPGQRDVRRRMRASGCSRAFVEEICAAVEASGRRGTHAIDAAAARIGRDLLVAPAPRSDGRPRLLALVGPTGVGKTTTVAKLADRLLRSGRQVGLVSLDGFRAGAVDQLRAFAERLQVPLFTPRDGAHLAQAAAAHGRFDALLLDTTGRSPRDARAIAEIQGSLERLAGFGPLTTYLTLAATASAASLERAWAGFTPLAPAGLVLTKLDEADSAGAAVELGRRHRLGFAFLCDGQDVARHLQRPTIDGLVDLCLRGGQP
jgi:flagellar biosynthesis protein FlhF